METGGLRPPPSSSEGETGSPRDVADEPYRDEDKDSERGLEVVWVEGEIGGQYVGLQTFHANSLVDAQTVTESGAGLMVGGAAGFRLFFLTLGARYRNTLLSDFNLWSLDGELGLRAQLGDVEPHVNLAAGYSATGALDLERAVAPGDGPVDISGANVRLGLGLDYYFTGWISLGAEATAEALFLQREKTMTVDPSVHAAAADVYAADGSSVGFGVAGSLVLGLHL